MLSVEDVRGLVAAEARQAGSLRKLAKRWRLSPVYLSHIVRGKRGIGPSVERRLRLIRMPQPTVWAKRR